MMSTMVSRGRLSGRRTVPHLDQLLEDQGGGGGWIVAGGAWTAERSTNRIEWLELFPLEGKGGVLEWDTDDGA